MVTKNKRSNLGKVAVSSKEPGTEIIIDSSKVVVPFEIAPGIAQNREIDIEDFIRNISSQAMIDTGLIPVTDTGLISLRQLGKYRQITYQIGPGMNYITWGESEHQKQKRTYYVASPYRIIIADLFDGDLLGARMFYSTEAISHPGQVLNHINLPNVNCRGYGDGNGVGWLCLYLRESWKSLDISSQIHAIVERAGGGEAYNDGNMSQTDGARFYQELKSELKYTWDPVSWEKKSKTDGVDWVLDPSNWVNVRVKSADDQSKHFSKGVPYTIDMAMRGTYKAYYSDVTPLKPINALSRTDKSLEDSITSGTTSFSYRSMIERSITMKESYGSQCVPKDLVRYDSEYSVGSWAAGTIKKITSQVSEAAESIDFKPKPIGKCKHCNESIYEGMDTTKVNLYGTVISSHITDDLFVKDEEEKIYHLPDMIWFDQGSEKGYYSHKSTPHGICKNCNICHDLSVNPNAFYAIENVKYAKCFLCAETKVCAVTGMSRLIEDLRKVSAMNPVTGLMQDYYVGEEHFSSMTLCLCNLLVPYENTNELLSNRGRICAQCVQHTPSGPRYEPGISIATKKQKKAQAKAVS